MDLITTKGLCKIYGGKMVIDHVDMHIPEASIYGFVGENGSGKTTIMRLLTGLAEPSAGSFTLFGVDNKDKKIYEVRQQVSAIVEATSLIPSMTARDNMVYQELYLGIKQSEAERAELLAKVHLDNVGEKKVKNFSLGMKQRLGIALALMNHPKLMLLDEPMNGLDPEGIAELRELLIELNQKEGITVLISSHILSELEKIASCYGFISHGKLLEEISAEGLQAKCRKSVNVKVSDVAKTEAILNKLNIKDYKAFPSGDVKIYENIAINDFVVALSNEGITVLGINSQEESVEEYYLNLIKEGK